jgi:signal transduction histidine kinase
MRENLLSADLRSHVPRWEYHCAAMGEETSLSLVRQGRLLLVEDDPELRSSLSELLVQDGYDVVAVSNGLDALRRLKQSEPVDLIVLDLMMPVMDGWQFRIEQRRDPLIAEIPVLAMSADNSAQAAAINADLYIAKPFEYASLGRSIERILKTQRLAHADRMAALGTLAAGIAHEINNPLAFVLSNLRYVLNQLPEHLPEHALDEDEELRDLWNALKESVEGCDRIRRIVRDVKSVSSTDDTGRSALMVHQVLESALNLVMNEIKPKAALRREYTPLPRVLANEARLAQVFVNLLLNAAQAIPPGAPRSHEICVSTTTSAAGHAVIEIMDTGTGIQEEIRSRIFEPFFTTKPLGVGTGLGLSICQGIVSAIGGSIRFDSSPGKGTCFRVELPPLIESESERPTAPPQPLSRTGG